MHFQNNLLFLKNVINNLHQYKNDQNKYKFYRTCTWNEVPKQVLVCTSTKTKYKFYFLANISGFSIKISSLGLDIPPPSPATNQL